MIDKLQIMKVLMEALLHQEPVQSETTFETHYQSELIGSDNCMSCLCIGYGQLQMQLSVLSDAEEEAAEDGKDKSSGV